MTIEDFSSEERFNIEEVSKGAYAQLLKWEENGVVKHDGRPYGVMEKGLIKQRPEYQYTRFLPWVGKEGSFYPSLTFIHDEQGNLIETRMKIALKSAGSVEEYSVSSLELEDLKQKRHFQEGINLFINNCWGRSKEKRVTKGKKKKRKKNLMRLFLIVSLLTGSGLSGCTLEKDLVATSPKVDTEIQAIEEPLKILEYSPDLSDLPPYIKEYPFRLRDSLGEEKTYALSLWDVSDGEDIVLKNGEVIQSGQQPETLFINDNPFDQGEVLLNQVKVSPEGNIVYFSNDRSGKSTEQMNNPGVVFIDRKGGRYYKVLGALDPSWTKDGIVFIQKQKKDIGQETIVFMGMPEDGFDPIFTDKGELRSPVLFLPERTLFFSKVREGEGIRKMDLIRVRLSDGKKEIIAEDILQTLFSWENSDEKLLAFISRGDSEKPRIFNVYNIQTGENFSFSLEDYRPLAFKSNHQIYCVDSTEETLYLMRFDKDGLYPKKTIFSQENTPYRHMILSFSVN